MRYKYVFWDWNGTVVDDALASLEAVNAMLDKRGRKRLDIRQYRDYIDVPIVRFYEKSFDMAHETMEAMSVEFDEYYDKFLCDEPVCADVRSVLEMLSASGATQFVYSSSRTELIKPAAEKYGISGFFQEIIGAEDRYVGSKTERTRKFVSESAINAHDALFVGDMVHDSEVAKAVGADCVLICGGHQSRSALEKTGCTVLNNINELPIKVFGDERGKYV